MTYIYKLINKYMKFQSDVEIAFVISAPQSFLKVDVALNNV